MQSVLLDDEWLAAELPEGFQPIPHDEVESIMGFRYDCLRGVRDTQRHMQIIVTWKDSGKLLSKIANPKIIAKQEDEVFAKRYRTRGYRSNGRFERAIAGASSKAYGFRFSYTYEGVPQEGETFVFKRDVRCYTLIYFSRSEVAEQNRPVFEGVLESLVVR